MPVSDRNEVRVGLNPAELRLRETLLEGFHNLLKSTA